MLPSNTSGKTQPLDVVLFKVFKIRLQDAFRTCAAPGRGKQYDIFYLCSLIAHAYDRPFTVHRIHASFPRSVIWPLDPMKLLNVLSPSIAGSAANILSPEDRYDAIQNMKEWMADEVSGSDAIIVRSAFIHASRGSVVTGGKALGLARMMHDADVRKVSIERSKACAADCETRPKRAFYLKRSA